LSDADDEEKTKFYKTDTSSKALWVSGVGLAPAQSRCGNTRDAEDDRSCCNDIWWLDMLLGFGDIPGLGDGRLRPGDPTPIGE